MTLEELTHIWSEVPPLSDVDRHLPSHVSVIWRTDSADSPFASARPAQAILASSLLSYDDDFFAQLPNLRIVCRTGIGIDNLDLEAATKHGIVCCHTPDGPTESTAEHTVAMLLALSKRLKQGNDNLAAGEWGPRSGMMIGDQVQGKTLGLLGLGRIGRRVGQICRLGLDMRVIGYDPFVSAEQAAALGFEWREQAQVIAEADYLSIHVPAQPETRHLINAARIEQMKDGAYLLNLSRGSLVDPEALLEAVNAGKLSGAGLDVFEPEPPDATSPLRNHPHIIATPHIAGVTKESRTLMEKMAIERTLTFFRGERPENVVNPEVLENH